VVGQRDQVESAGQLLRNKLGLLQGSAPRRNLALDILTGRTPVEVTEEPEAPLNGVDLATEESGSEPRATQRKVLARTVYLSDEDVRDIEFIIRAWRRRVHKRVSRSEVLRQAIGNLRDAVELGAAPRALAPSPSEGGRRA
jgi:hypothetical protein